MLWGIGGLIALAVGFFIGLGGFLSPLALFLGIAGIVKEKSIAAWLSAIGGFIGFAVILITRAGAEITVTNFFVSLWDFLVLCFVILFAIAILLWLASYPITGEPLAKTTFGIFILLAIGAMCAWLVIHAFWTGNLKPVEICFLVYLIATTITLIINFIHSVKLYIDKNSKFPKKEKGQLAKDILCALKVIVFMNTGFGFLMLLFDKKLVPTIGAITLFIDVMIIVHFLFKRNNNCE